MDSSFHELQHTHNMGIRGIEKIWQHSLNIQVNAIKDNKNFYVYSYGTNRQNKAMQ